MNAERHSATTARTNIFPIRVLVIMGVSGCGKSAVGAAVARQWNADFQDADHWHSPEAVTQMAAGLPLTDQDRAPWLARLREKVIGATVLGQRTVLACSALRACYREVLREGQDGVQFVFLSGTQELIAARLSGRAAHYMPASLLDSQFAALEVPGPEEAITIEINQSLTALVQQVLAVVS